MSNQYAWIVILATVAIIAASGWAYAVALLKKLRESERTTVILDIEKLKAEAALRDKLAKEQEEKTQAAKLAEATQKVTNADNDNTDPCLDLDNAAQGK